jgi:hypothetical protein
MATPIIAIKPGLFPMLRSFGYSLDSIILVSTTELVGILDGIGTSSAS